MKTVAIVKEVNETELVATWTPHDTEVKVGDWLCLETEWQGLTDDEIDAIMEDDSVIDIACALEAKLKEKNHE